VGWWGEVKEEEVEEEEEDEDEEEDGAKDNAEAGRWTIEDGVRCAVGEDDEGAEFGARVVNGCGVCVCV
jgi:hypothetical protein